MRVINSLSYDFEAVQYEVNSGELITVPDQSYTVREILEKFTSGLIPEMHEYYDESDFDPENEFELDPTTHRDFDLSDYQLEKERNERALATKSSDAFEKTESVIVEEEELSKAVTGESSGSDGH